MYPRLIVLWCQLCILPIFANIVLARYEGPNYEALPTDTIFPGPWEKYIRAPVNKHAIIPIGIYQQEGDVQHAEDDDGSKIFTLSSGGLVTFEFAENIAGRVCLNVGAVAGDSVLGIAYSESPAFIGRLPDATTDRQERDLPLYLPIKKSGIHCVANDFIRGGFKYLTVYTADTKDDSWLGFGQKLLGYAKPKPWVSMSSVWVNCTAFPSNTNGRAYTGYFDSSSSLLNRIWYSGAWTLQLSTIDPREGSALIDENRNFDKNKSPTGSWYSNFTISNGTSVTTDGAKRDRVVWPGDMSIAVPGIAVSTYDMLAVRNALDTLFDHQYGDGSLPYAGPPMSRGLFSDTYHLHTLLGAYNYVIFSGDVEWLNVRWPAYLKALDISIAKVDEYNLLHVSSTADWLRPGMTGHNLEASAILYDVLLKSVECSKWIDEFRGMRCSKEYQGGRGTDCSKSSNHITEWLELRSRLKKGLETLYCELEGLFADNIGRRGCTGPEKVLSQDGNSWILMSHHLKDERKLNISQNLRQRWGKYGAPAPEFPNTISPFATSFELLGHCAAGNFDAAVELMELQWGYMLDGPGFTNSTLAEGYRVDGDAQYPAYWSSARNSHAHGWSTGPTSVLVQEILGIRLVAPLGREWRIEPRRTKWLQFVRGGFATRLGKFEVGVTLMRELGGGREIEVLSFSTPEGSSGAVVWGGKEETFMGGDEVKVVRWMDAENMGNEWIEWDAEMERRFVMDEEWVKPELEVREPGVVDWEALELNYVDGPGMRDFGNGVSVDFRTHVEMLELERAERRDEM